MDIYHASATAMRIPTRERNNHTAGRPSRSSSNTSSDSVRSREPMTIPGARFDEAPPPLPPPRYNEELERGIDVAWSWGNSDSIKAKQPGRLAPIKAGSSLYGGYLQTRGDSKRSPDRDDMDVDVHVDGVEDAGRRGSNVSTIRSASQADITGCVSIPSLVGRAPSPSMSNQKLHGEKPLAQENFTRSSQAYDQRVLSKIGKPNSPPRHLRSDSTDSCITAQKLPLQPDEDKSKSKSKPQSQRLAINEFPSASLDSVSRWVASPTSAGVSPGAQPGCRDYYMAHRSPSMDSTGPSLVLDPELFVHSRSSGRPSTGGLVPCNDDAASQISRSNRDSYDHTIFSEADPEFSHEDSGALRHLNLTDSSRMERKPSRQGMKRRALSPPSEVARDDRHGAYSTELYQKVNPAPAGSARSAISASRYNSRFGSVSSTSSSVRHNSYTSSLALSVAGSSMTSISSFDRQSPSEFSQLHPYITSAPQTSSPATSITLSKSKQAQHSPDNNSISRKMSISTAVSDPPSVPPTRIGNYYICECCPKKPRKFEREDGLRAHQMEKQYACQYCNNRFKNKNEAERHQNSLHLRRHSWSCAAIPGYQAAFHSSTPNPSKGPNPPVSDTCGFCGEEFANFPQPDWDRRIDHLTNVHKFGECNQAKKFYRADHFRQHLKHSHAGQSGKWTNLLESVCLREESPSDGVGVSPTGSECSQGRGPSSLPTPADAPMGGATIDETSEEP